MTREATRLDYLHEVEHMRERVARLEQAITDGGQAGLTRITASCQRSAGTEGYRRDLGSNHRSRIGPGVPL
jgi:hypothetical protein